MEIAVEVRVVHPVHDMDLVVVADHLEDLLVDSVLKEVDLLVVIDCRLEAFQDVVVVPGHMEAFGYQ